MPGMGTGLNENDPTIVSAFHAALLRQLLVVLLILLVLAMAWNVPRSVQLRRASAADGVVGIRPAPAVFHEPAGRRLLRISFGLIWILDGILQGQAARSPTSPPAP